MKKVFALCLMVFMLTSFTAVAADNGPFYVPGEVEEGSFPNIKIGSQAFMSYTYSRVDDANFNSFNINRALLYAHGKLAENWLYGLAFDVAPLFNLVSQNVTLSDGTTAGVVNSNAGNVQLDLAFLGYDFGDHKIYIGVIDTVFEGYVLYNVWEHRRVALGPLGGNGYSTAGRWDLGLALNGMLMNDIIEYHFGIYNGESYMNLTEMSNHKSIQARVTLKPFEEVLAFTIGMEYDKANAGVNNQVIIPIILAADLMEGMVKPGIIFAWERMEGENAYMLSFLINAYLMDDKVNPFVRFDYGIKNDIATAGTAGAPNLGEKDVNLFAGIGYHFNKHVVVDAAFIWMHDDAADVDSFTLGPFAEVRF